MEDMRILNKSGLLHIIKNDFLNRDDFYKAAQSLGLNSGKKKIMIALLYKGVEEQAECIPKEQLIERTWNQNLKKHRLSEGASILSVLSNNHFIVLSDYSILDMTIDILTEMADLFNANYKVGIGNPFDQPEYLSISYKEALEAIYQCGLEQTINTYCVGLQEDNEDITCLAKTNRKVIDALETGKFSDVPEIVSDFFTQIHYREPDQALNMCLSSIHTILEYFGIDQFTQFKIKYRFDLVGSSVNEIIHAIKATYMDNLVRIMDIIKNMRGNPAEYVIKKMQEIVLKNYSDQDLSLLDVSNKLHISYGYLSKLIKQKMGYSFVSYLISIRMSYAKKLLCDGGMKVYEVAKAVGFSSSGYFITSFKKYYGISPSDFREGFSKESNSN